VAISVSIGEVVWAMLQVSFMYIHYLAYDRLSRPPGQNEKIGCLFLTLSLPFLLQDGTQYLAGLL